MASRAPALGTREKWVEAAQYWERVTIVLSRRLRLESGADLPEAQGSDRIPLLESEGPRAAFR